jgi:alpha-beta hydrolase superfamily lysophospholipase
VAAEHREGHLVGRRGRRLYWQSWMPDGPPRATVAIAHGASEHGGRYRYVVERLLPEGYAVYAIDHRGHGRSEGARAMLDRVDDVVADLDQLVEQAAGEHPDVPHFLLGHSMGGCIALAYALRHQRKLSGLALSAPVAALETAPLGLRLAARALSVVAPRLGVYEVEAEGVSRDPDEVRAYDDDPLVYRGKLPARTVQELADAVGGFEAALPSLTLPILLMHGTADRIVPIAGSEMVAGRAGSDDVTFHRYEGFYHELFNEPPAERERPLGDLAAWLGARARSR